MKISFVIIIDDVKKLDKKLNELSFIKNKQIILIGNEKYKDKYNKYEYYIDNCENYSKSFNNVLKNIDGDIINFSLSSSYILKKGLKESINIFSKEKQNIYSFIEYKKYNSTKLKIVDKQYSIINIEEDNSKLNLYIELFSCDFINILF